jgi:hypothetical protein
MAAFPKVSCRINAIPNESQQVFPLEILKMILKPRWNFKDPE